MLNDQEALEQARKLLYDHVHDYAKHAAEVFKEHGWVRIGNDGRSVVTPTAEEIEKSLLQRIEVLPPIPLDGNYTSIEWNRIRVEVERCGQTGYPEWHARFVIIADTETYHVVPSQIEEEKPVATDEGNPSTT